MTTMLDCIYRSPEKIDAIIVNRRKTFRDLVTAVTKKKYNEIFFVGSGTSNTTAQTSVRFVEKVSGLSAQAMVPNMFLNKTVYNANAIYVFTSQSGTSILTQKALKKVKDMGYLTVAITGQKGTPLDSEADVWVNMGCDYEEFGMRTIGYCTSVFTQEMLGLEIGLAIGNLAQKEYDAYIEDAMKISAGHKAVADSTCIWFEKNKDVLSSGNDIIIYGANDLYGLALEGALKILEVAKRFIAVGYEMDDGLHGPTMGFTDKHRVLILNDGTNEKIADGLATMMKEKFDNHGFVIGMNAKGDSDLSFVPVTENFHALEYAPSVQIISYLLAHDYGVKIPNIKMMQSDAEESKYFNTHEENTI